MSPSPRRSRTARAVHGAVLDALERVLEEGVPRSAVAGVDYAVLREWERVVTHAERAATALRERWPRVRATDPALVPLAVVARAVAMGARSVGLGPAIDAGTFPELAGLERALAAALAHAQAAHDEALRAALTGSAA